ncbi:DUF4179 domain-containing protein [Gramella sp. AN32]|uniref:DUF4179 domain-containing protein n=1 Tax=Christiangramia antarctica TaxID=2058158 RepID=A0ABW5X5B9_9FLAO|nr:DUF4179 domain-containing protein [Gramella sp. AN32]MCM4158023.1 hypothetical protein [Gramella sp. AN32]
MKNNDSIEQLFKNLDFNIREPRPDHEERFFEKLKDAKNLQTPENSYKRWYIISSIAAVFILGLLIAGQFFGYNLNVENADLASVSSEMKQTQEFYTGVISKELISLKENKTPETAKVIEDAILQLDKLEKEYQDLRSDLNTSGKDNRVVHAMIQNFQQRIDLLNKTLIQIEQIKEFKKENYEINTI